MPNTPASSDAATNSGASSTDGESTNKDGNLPGGSTSDAGDDSPITLTPRQLAARLEEARRRARPGDYDDLRSKAARLDEIEEAQKTEAQKATEALNREKARADAAERAALSLRIATEHHLGADDADLLAGLPDEDAMRKLAKRLEAQHADEAAGDQGQGQQRVGYGVDHSHTQSSPPPSADDAARAFFGI